MAENVTLKKEKRAKADEWRPLFIATLRNTANVRAASQAAGITRRTAYRNREACEEFKQAWDEAIEDACDILEANAFKRANTTSDTLLIFLLKAHRPAKYRETIDHNHNHRLMADEVARLKEQEGLTDAEAEAAIREAHRIMAGKV